MQFVDLIVAGIYYFQIFTNFHALFEEENKCCSKKWFVFVMWNSVVSHLGSLLSAALEQNGWGKTALVEEGVHPIQQDPTLQDDNCSSTCDRCILLPISHIESCDRRLWLVAYISDMWDLVCHFLDSWSVSQMASYQPRDLPGQTLTKVNKRNIDISK